MYMALDKNEFRSRYNWYNHVDNYRIFLYSDKGLSKVSIKNYISDVNFFIKWSLAQFVQSNPDSSIDFASSDFYKLLFAKDMLADFRTYLIQSKLPFRSINRRLSALRSFSSYLHSQKLLDEGSGKSLKNFYSESARTNAHISPASDSLRNALMRELSSDDELNSALFDIEEFRKLTNLNMQF